MVTRAVGTGGNALGERPDEPALAARSSSSLEPPGYQLGRHYGPHRSALSPEGLDMINEFFLSNRAKVDKRVDQYCQR